MRRLMASGVRMLSLQIRQLLTFIIRRHGEKCGSPLADCLQGDVVVRDGTDSKQSPTHTHEKDTVKHGSFFARVGSRHGDVADEQAQRVGYSRAEKVRWVLYAIEERGSQCVSLAIMSILPPATITMLSPVGEALVRARESGMSLN